MSHFILQILLPKPKIVGEGSLSIGKDGVAEFFEGNADRNASVLATLVRVKLDHAAAAGLFLSGMEPDGFDRAGRPKFKYQEWLLRHLDRK